MSAGNSFVTIIATPVSAPNGGTGVANAAGETITINGGFSLAVTLTGNTGVTFPTSGTIATLDGAETLSNKTLTAVVSAAVTGNYTSTNGNITLTNGVIAATNGSITTGGFFDSGAYRLSGSSVFTAIGILMRNASMQIAAGSSTRLYWTDNADGFAGTENVGLQRNANGVIRVTGTTAAAIRALLGGGAAVASASPLPVPTGRVFHVTGTTNFSAITSTNFQAGVQITIIFDGILTITGSGTLILVGGTMVTSANDTLSLIYDGAAWFETGRTVL